MNINRSDNKSSLEDLSKCFQRGIKHLQQNKNAIDKCRRTAECYPKNKDEYHKIAISYKKKGQLKQAEYFEDITDGPYSYRASELSLVKYSNKVLFFFLLALIVRLLYLFFMVPIDWIGDSYHHWQIAWYTLKVGLAHGRMWDLKGCEYYWPPLPSLFEAFLIWLFQSPSIMFMRLANAIFSSLSVAISYLIGRRYGEGVGETLAIAIIFSPFTLNYDVLALHEPLMVLFALTGILKYLEDVDFQAGLFIGLSYLCHYASYILAPILVLIYLIYHKSLEKLFAFLMGFAVVYIPYAYMLSLQTGDFFYNIHTLITFMRASTATMRSHLAPIIGSALLFVALASLIIAYYKGKKAVPMIVLFSGYAFFWGFLLTFIGAPLSPYERRYYLLLFIFGFFCLSLIMNHLPLFRLTLNLKGVKIGISSIFLTLLSISLLIYTIPTYVDLQSSVIYSFNIADDIAEFYDGRTIISPVPSITYRLTTQGGIPPQDILGPIYCPTEQNQKMTWLKKHNVSLLLWVPGYEADRVFPELRGGEDVPPFFLVKDFDGNMFLYEVRWR